MSFKEIVQRTIHVEAKIDLKSSIIVWLSDIYYSRSHRLFNSVSTVLKVLTQGTTAKESCSKESMPKETKLANEKALIPPRTNVTESLEQGKKD